MLPDIAGLDHLVVLVRDLAASAETWRRLGFTVSPRGDHSANLATANHTIMFGPNYIELLAVTGEAASNARWRRTLAAREGLAGAALALLDADRAAARLGRAVRRFGRPVAMPDGRVIEARFAVFDIDDDAAPDLRLFACQHLVREATWAPGLTDHANTAQAVARVELVDADPAGVAARLDDLAGGNAAAFEAITPAEFRDRHGVAPLAGPAAIVIQVADRDAAERALEAVPHRFVGPGIEVVASGVLLRFE
jgi:catechol 2,3-dioxygenase-like lactoylglutathione lyase family enzyme